MPFISNTGRERRKMLDEIGAESVEELFSDIPPEIPRADLKIPPGKSELEVRKHLRALAEKNSSDLVCFLGAGFYDHYIPSAVSAVESRSEFYTAYTPYQAEASQGTLQAMYEYQTGICELTGLEVSNASLYDGGTAIYEAVMMSIRITGRRKVVMGKGMNPIYREMVNTYTKNLDVGFEEADISPDGRADRDKISKLIDDETACVILQNPNFFGCVDDFSDIAGTAHENGALLVVSCYPVSLGILKPPGEMGADIAVGEAQSLGLGLYFGGPYLGFMAAKEKYVRQMPGRIAGLTLDSEGRPGFVLTLQTREQHIRRARATSNICSNEALCALSASCYMALLGKRGIRELAGLCGHKAGYALERLCSIPGVRKKFSAPVFNEFVLELPAEAGAVIGKLIEKGIAAGFPLGYYYPGMKNCMLVALTEKRTREEIGCLAEALEAVL
jgi:glycine dehydrogenase subunit 1